MREFKEIKELKESPVIEKGWDSKRKNLAIMFPNLYYGGIYGLGPLIIYNLVNGLKDWSCKRRFLDYSDLKGFEFLGFTFQYELDYFNFFKILDKNNIPREKEKRENWKIFFGGGPAVSLNTAPMEDYLDVFFLGDCEDSLVEVLDMYSKQLDEEGKENFSKKSFLESVCDIEGVYVPGLTKIKSYGVVDLETAPYPLVQPLPLEDKDEFVFGKSFILELERGCPFNCEFCVIPTISGKFRYRSVEKLKKIIDEGLKINEREKVVIYAPSFVHPKQKEILQYLIDKELKFSVPSLRAEMVDEETLKLIGLGGQKSLTIAPESCERVRFDIGKKVKDEAYYSLLEKAEKLNFKKIKMYIMIGFENETEEDLVEISKFVKNCCKIFSRKISLSINTLVPKNTINSNKKPIDKKLAKSKFKKIKELLKDVGPGGRIKIKFSNINSSAIEGKLSLEEKSL
ncbi:radical SAM protein [Candidatus Woesearchaeota archaeon]|jgi:radical SAM superfamily enzyme YgiQ (UPF0313 family)|nr:radical SAM protein [Candidatus Woesearchaeota archaeon]MBT4208023.1 radical SAM protein [Candidatus Woesearchaeota archaeon]MBT5111548.1 radical SAM protein [Candidatus Woesearchaeota archaeon]MBT6761183.1 radical SAM protein [Candidatus Woesearchaeota archaeon]MBT7557674.1 radical SAM protein [Candidatus Woesearchaeota archaeon]